MKDYFFIVKGIILAPYFVTIKVISTITPILKKTNPNEELCKLQQQNECLINQNKYLTIQVETLKEQLEDTKTQFDAELVKFIDTTKADLAVKTQQITEINAQKEELLGQLDKTTREYNHLAKNLEKKCDDYLQANNKLQQQIKEMSQIINEKSEQLDVQIQQNKRLDAEILQVNTYIKNQEQIITKNLMQTKYKNYVEPDKVTQLKKELTVEKLAAAHYKTYLKKLWEIEKTSNDKQLRIQEHISTNMIELYQNYIKNVDCLRRIRNLDQQIQENNSLLESLVISVNNSKKITDQCKLMQLGQEQSEIHSLLTHLEKERLDVWKEEQSTSRKVAENITKHIKLSDEIIVLKNEQAYEKTQYYKEVFGNEDNKYSITDNWEPLAELESGHKSTFKRLTNYALTGRYPQVEESYQLPKPKTSLTTQRIANDYFKNKPDTKPEPVLKLPDVPKPLPNETTTTTTTTTNKPVTTNTTIQTSTSIFKMHPTFVGITSQPYISKNPSGTLPVSLHESDPYTTNETID